jgi:membrane-associated protein
VDLLAQLADIVLNLEHYLQWLVAHYGVWIYAILFLVIFCETGLVVTPFLPGDSLLFAAGTVAAAGGMYVHGLFAVLVTASFAGDNANYWIGRFVGPRVFTSRKSRLFNPAHLERTRRFYERHGGKTVTIARFVPVIRTFAPFVAGIGRMHYPRFLFYSFAGSVLWISSLTYAGYYFGTLPLVRENLALVIAGIVVLSVMPGVVEYFRHRRTVTGSPARPL